MVGVFDTSDYFAAGAAFQSVNQILDCHTSIAAGAQWHGAWTLCGQGRHVTDGCSLRPESSSVEVFPGTCAATHHPPPRTFLRFEHPLQLPSMHARFSSCEFQRLAVLIRHGPLDCDHFVVMLQCMLSLDFPRAFSQSILFSILKTRHQRGHEP